MASLEDRFEAKVDRRGERHLWTGARRGDGSGVLKVAGKLVTAQRVAWELDRGPLPAGARVSVCTGEKACVRIDHLTVAGAETPQEKPARQPQGLGSLREVRPGTWKLTVQKGWYDDGRQRRSRMNQARSLLAPMFRWAKDRNLIRQVPIASNHRLPKSTKIATKVVAPEVDQLALYLST